MPATETALPNESLSASLRAMVRLALPVVLAELGWMLQGVVDVIMVGRLGPVAIGAVALGNAIYYPVALFAFGLLLGMDTVVSQSFGRGDRDACSRALAQGVYIALLAAVPAALVSLLLGIVLHRFGVNPELIAPARTYLYAVVWGTLPLLLYAAARRYLQAVGEVRVITVTFVVANLVNWAANQVLIYGRLGLPAMGVRGSAYSTVLARVVMAVMLFAYAGWYERRRGYALWQRWPRPILKQIVTLLRLGLPAALHLLVEVAAFETATILAARLSVVALAAHQIALNFAALAFMVPLGISAAAAISVGHAIGAHDPAGARRSGWVALALAVSFMVCSAAVFLAVPRSLIALYTSELAIIQLGVPLLAWAALFAVFDGVQVVLTGALRGMGLTRVPMVANFVGYWILGLPIGVLLAFHSPWLSLRGISGIWSGLTSALIVVALTLLLYWYRHSERLI